MTIEGVARDLNFGWNPIPEIQKSYLEKHSRRLKLGERSRLAIDEISVGKGQQPLTPSIDLTTGAMACGTVGKGGCALQSFGRRLRSGRARMQAVATGMFNAYIRAARKDPAPGHHRL